MPYIDVTIPIPYLAAAGIVVTIVVRIVRWLLP